MGTVRAIALALMLLAPSMVFADDKGQVTSVLTRQSERLYAVRVVSVDGENLPMARQLIRLEPGKRRLGVVALIERDNAFNLNRRERPQPKYVEIDVEAGKHYRIGAKVNDPAYREWSTVVEFR
jgi:hypothetical protein